MSARTSKVLTLAAARRAVKRFALIGGIYSNWRALETRSRTSRGGRSRHILLGDLGAFGPYPDRVFPLLQQAGVLCLQGTMTIRWPGGLADCQCGYTDSARQPLRASELRLHVPQHVARTQSVARHVTDVRRLM
jgi:hypothetical protein